MTQDFLVTDQASVWLFKPLNEIALKFVRDSVNFDELLWRGNFIVADFRDAGVLAEELEDEGFSVVTRH